jgi:AcrR family transcriptional regulator
MAATGAGRAAKFTDEQDPAAERGPEPAPARVRRRLPAEERRRQIILAAQEVFARSNLQGARTRDIAKAADINQATLFEHFESKEALFQEAVVKPLVEAMRGMQQRAEAYEAATSREEMQALAQVSAARHLTTMLEAFPLLTASLFSDAELGGRLYREQIAPIIEERGEVLRELLDETHDPKFVGLAIFGVMFAVAMDQAFKDKPDDVSELAAQVTQLFTRGFLKPWDRD